MDIKFDYKSKVNHLLSIIDPNTENLKHIRLENIYFFENDPIFIEPYNYLQSALNDYASAFDGCKGILLFLNEPTKNASAFVVEKTFVILFHRDIIVEIHELAKQIELNQSANKSKFEETFNPNSLISQFSILYIFFHELGHILQESSATLFPKKNMNSSTDEDFFYTDHLKEFDSDMFSVGCLVQTLDFFISKNEITESDTIRNLVQVSVTSIFVIFIIVLGGIEEPFYLRKNSHPHQYVRIISVLPQFLTSIRSKYSIDKDDIDKMKQFSIEICDMILKKNKGEDFLARNWFNQMSNNKDEAKKYVRILKTSLSLGLIDGLSYKKILPE